MASSPSRLPPGAPSTFNFVLLLHSVCSMFTLASSGAGVQIKGMKGNVALGQPHKKVKHAGVHQTTVMEDNMQADIIGAHRTANLGCRNADNTNTYHNSSYDYSGPITGYNTTSTMS